jgi:hypothetical protein
VQEYKKIFLFIRRQRTTGPERYTMKGTLSALPTALAVVLFGSTVQANPCFDCIHSEQVAGAEVLLRPAPPVASSPLALDPRWMEPDRHEGVSSPALKCAPDPTGAGVDGTGSSDDLAQFHPAGSRALQASLGWRVNVPSRRPTRYVSALPSQIDSMASERDIPLPEPTSIVLLTIGLATAMLGLVARRQLRHHGVAVSTVKPIERSTTLQGSLA